MKRNKRLMKKLYSVLIALVMVLSVMGDTNLVVNAATEVDVVDVSVTIPLVGSTEHTINASVSAGANYDVAVVPKSDTGYSGWTDGGGYEMTPGQEFEDGIIYKANLEVTPKAGYSITENTIVKVNGVDVAGDVSYGAAGEAYIDFESEPQLLGTIDSISLTNVPQGNVGETAAPYSQSGTNYSASGYWEIYNSDNDSWEYIDGTHTFASGKVYRFVLDVYPSEGYLFAYNITLSLNGQQQESYGCSNYWVGMNKVVSHAVEITEVTYDKEAPLQIKVGDTYDGSKVSISVPSGSNYTAYGYWYDENGNHPTSFENGKEYYLSVTIVANDGYSFAENVKLNGQNYYSDGMTISDGLEKSFKEIIDKVEITGLPVPEIGKDIDKGSSSDFFELKVPADADYTAMGVWSDSNQNVVSGQFEEGKAYNLAVIATAKEGAEFAEDAIMEIDGVSYKPVDTEENMLRYTFEYSFRKQIDKVDMTGLKEPKVGDAATVDNIKIPADVNYEIENVAWVDWDTGEEVTTFEDGHSYVIAIDLVPKEGYEFSKDVVATMDGKDVTKVIYTDGEMLSYFEEYSFKEVISEVKLDNVQTATVGAQSSTDVKIPADANYELTNADWYVWNDELQYSEPFTGVFQEGETYSLYVEICPKEGYEFNRKSTTFFVNGVEDDTANIYDNWIDYEVYYSFGLKEISVVEITIAAPVAGAHASIAPVVTAPEGVNFIIGGDLYMNPAWLEGESDSFSSYDSYFEEGGSYGTMFDILAKEGYVFSKNLQVIVNGNRLNEDNVYIENKVTTVRYFFDEECNHSYSAWKDAGDGTHVRNCAVCGQKDSQSHTYEGTKCSVCGVVKSDSSPATGDTSAVMNVFMLMVVCGAGMIVLNGTKKRSAR